MNKSLEILCPSNLRYVLYFALDLDLDRQSHDRNMKQLSMRDREKNEKGFTGGPDFKKKCFVMWYDQNELVYLDMGMI